MDVGPHSLLPTFIWSNIGGDARGNIKFIDLDFADNFAILLKSLESLVATLDAFSNDALRSPGSRPRLCPSDFLFPGQPWLEEAHRMTKEVVA